MSLNYKLSLYKYSNTYLYFKCYDHKLNNNEAFLHKTLILLFFLKTFDIRRNLCDLVFDFQFRFRTAYAKSSF